MHLPVNIKIECRDTLDVVGHCGVLHLVGLYSAEHNLGVLIGVSSALVDGFESDAGSTAWRPEVDDNTRVLLDDLLEVRVAFYLEDFVLLWLGVVCGGLLSTGTTTHVLLHHLLYRWVVHHAGHVWWDLWHASHTTGHSHRWLRARLLRS